MKTMPRIIMTMACATLIFTGCRQADRAKTAAPSLAELPSYEWPESVLSANIGVEGQPTTKARILVPRFEKIEPTPEEKKILGIKEEPQLDVLALYRPPPRPEQGISADSGALFGITDSGSMSVGTELVERRYWNGGYAGRGYEASAIGREGAGVGRMREPAGFSGIPWTVLVGEGGAREPAARETRRSR